MKVILMINTDDYSKVITATKPSLPDFDEFATYLKQIWETRHVTNIGKFHKQFEAALCEYLHVDHISLFCNGTSALQVGISALELTGEVITTPFTFAATAHAISWNRCTPVFCDIDRTSFGLDPNMVKALISPRTTAIVPVHVYGIPCHCKELQQIADKHGLKVLYDAAHTFGVFDRQGRSLVSHGDISMISFHATKVFNTFEGGALILSNAEMKKKVDYLKNFGFANETTIVGNGINGKMNEFSAALGLLQLKYIDGEICKRNAIAEHYGRRLEEIDGIVPVRFPTDYRRNHCYYPVLITSDYSLTRDELVTLLERHDIYPRRYFFPLLTDVQYYRNLPSARFGTFPVATGISNQILCLPIYGDLLPNQVDKICDLLANGHGAGRLC